MQYTVIYLQRSICDQATLQITRIGKTLMESEIITKCETKPQLEDRSELYEE